MQTVMFLQDYKRVAEESIFNNRIEQHVEEVTPAEEVHAEESIKSH